jgi:putative transposase
MSGVGTLTYLPAQVIGRWFHLYPIQDLYSHKIVGWEAHGYDSSDHAVQLVRPTALAEGIAPLSDKPVLHGDVGSTIKAITVLAMLKRVGVKPSLERMPNRCYALPSTALSSLSMTSRR